MRFCGDEGLFRAYESVEFTTPLHAPNDWIEAHRSHRARGEPHHACKFEIWKMGWAREARSTSRQRAEFPGREPMPIVPSGDEDDKNRDEG